MVKLITVTIVAVAVCLVESAEQCTEEFLTAMVDTVCALNKRSFSHNSPIIWSALQQNLNNMELRYKEMMTGTDQVEELLLGDILLKRKPKDRNAVTRRRPIHLSTYEDIMMRRKAPKPSNVDGRTVNKRDYSDIMSRMKKCCRISCSPEDFKDACEKK